MSVRFELQGATALLTMTSPATRNALSAEMRAGPAQAVATVRDDQAIRAMSSGQAAADAASWRSRMHDIQGWFSELILLDRHTQDALRRFLDKQPPAFRWPAQG
ncbi:MAG: hypothetical protein RLZZ584_2108 [Pseudomonadota bacterium]|jgi:2-(1,2-epoxy-1,2-dihydrophenyl)acetyl-CoA isomerase